MSASILQSVKDMTVSSSSTTNGSAPALLDNPSFVLAGIHKTYFEDRPIPELGAKDVLIEIAKTGICGSDVHYHEHGKIGDFVVEEPMCLGHESSGTVVRIGDNVTTHKIGDRVALEPGVSCRSCDACKIGRYELCAAMCFAATPPNTSGTLTRYYALPADIAHHIPESMSFEDGALIEPLAVGVHSVSTLAKVKAGDTVAVFGAGPVGLLCMAVAKALGAFRVIAIDINAERLAFAKSYAATDIFQPSPPQANEKRIEFSKRSTKELIYALGLEERGFGGVNVVIEASGAEPCIQMGMYLVKEAGVYIQVGMGSPDVSVPMGAFANKQAIMQGSFRYGAGDYQFAIALVAAGRIDLKPLVTHRYSFKDAVQAFNDTKNGQSSDGKGIIKAMIDPPLKSQ